jgi:TniQ
MIGTLPSPYPGELLYSLCARYCDRMQYPSKRSVVQDLFGTRNVIASVWLPSRLNEFVAALAPGHHSSADDLIDNHTLLPFYAPFVLPERLRQLRQDMHGRNGPGIHMRLGIMASRVPLPQWLRLCPQCVEDDRKQYSECYWHRVHQVPGVEVCPIHETRLQNSSVRARSVKTRYEFVPAERALLTPGQPALPDHYLEILLRLARDAQWLLDHVLAT